MVKFVRLLWKDFTSQQDLIVYKLLKAVFSSASMLYSVGWTERHNNVGLHSSPKKPRHLLYRFNNLFRLVLTWNWTPKLVTCVKKKIHLMPYTTTQYISFYILDSALHSLMDTNDNNNKKTTPLWYHIKKKRTIPLPSFCWLLKNVTPCLTFLLQKRTSTMPPLFSPVGPCSTKKRDQYSLPLFSSSNISFYSQRY